MTSHAEYARRLAAAKTEEERDAIREEAMGEFFTWDEESQTWLSDEEVWEKSND